MRKAASNLAQFDSNEKLFDGYSGADTDKTVAALPLGQAMKRIQKNQLDQEDRLSLPRSRLLRRVY